MDAREPPSPDLRPREVGAVVAAAALLAVAMTWPLVLHLRTSVLHDLGDPLLQAWQLAWGGHALATDPAGIFQSNTFWPLQDSLAFSDALLGYAPAGLVGSGLAAATVRYGLLVLLACTLTAVGAHLLARELGARPLPAAIAGVVFAWAPWRLDHLGHLNVLSTGGVPLSLFLLVRGYRRRRWGVVLAGWLVATWQISIGFAVGLPFAYALAAIGLVTVAWWLRAGRPDPGRSVRWATVVGVAVLLVWTAVQATPYLRVLERHPEAERTVGYLEIYSPPPSGLLAAPAGSVLWGGVTEPLREGMRWPPEQTRFPGAVALVLGTAAAVAGTGSRRLRTGLAVGTVVSTVLALGTTIAGGRFTYLLLHQYAPGWQGVRTPGRLIMLTTLGLALLGALGADRLLGDRSSVRRGWRVAAVASLLALAVLEGAGRIAVLEVPRPTSEEAVTAAAPRLHLPTSITGDQVYMLWSTIDGFPPIVNGTSGFEPRSLADLRAEVETFPDANSVAGLRDLGVETVVLHLDRVPGTPWAETEHRPVAGLGITRREVPNAVVYDLGGNP